MYSRGELAQDFTRLGVAAGDVVMLHASVRAVGDVAGGPDQIHLALSDAVGERGTVMMYPACPDGYDEIGKGDMDPDQELELAAKLPVWDPQTARAQRDNGVLVEFFRSYPGTRVNPHVARFAARGAHVDVLFREQPWNYAYGRGSALERFVDLDGKILLLGSDHDQVTFLHYAEHVVDVPDKRVVRSRVHVSPGVWRDCEEFDTSEPAHQSWPEKLFRNLVDGYLEQSGNRGNRVGDAASYLFSARGLLEYALPKMRALAGV